MPTEEEIKKGEERAEAMQMSFNQRLERLEKHKTEWVLLFKEMYNEEVGERKKLEEKVFSIETNIANWQDAWIKVSNSYLAWHDKEKKLEGDIKAIKERLNNWFIDKSSGAQDIRYAIDGKLMSEKEAMDAKDEEQPEYLCLKLQKHLDVMHLRNLLHKFIDGDTAIGLSVKWLDIAELLLEAEGQKDPKRYMKKEYSPPQDWIYVSEHLRILKENLTYQKAEFVQKLLLIIKADYMDGITYDIAIKEYSEEQE